jgi:hypothetical protein
MDRKEYLKQWRRNNKEKVKDYQATYFQENKETIYKKRKENETEIGYKCIYNEQTKICMCGKELKVKSLYNHRKICEVYKHNLDK